MNSINFLYLFIGVYIWKINRFFIKWDNGYRRGNTEEEINYNSGKLYQTVIIISS